MLERKVETCQYDLITMAVGLFFHILSQLQGSVLYGDCTDLQGRSEVYMKLGEFRAFYLKFKLQC
jgi:hypothetical protein